MKEIITLQLGHQSNHVAAHFWNAQESYFTFEPGQEPSVNHDVHWRQGIAADGSDTFTPRTVIYDLKGGFGSMRQINDLYDPDPGADPASSSLWASPPVVRVLPAVPVAEYQRSLDLGSVPSPLTPQKVRFWSDFSRVFFHPKSLVQLGDYELHSSLEPFEKWATGDHLFGLLDREHDIVDRDLRPFAEEADQMQGISVLASLSDSWSGFASRYVEALRDDYAKTPIWVWGTQQQLPPLSKEAQLRSLVNLARGIVGISGNASLLIPIGLNSTSLPPSMGVDMSSLWHTSSLLSAAIETATLPTRLKTSAGDCDSLHSMVEALVVGDRRKIASLVMRLDTPQPGGQASGSPLGLGGRHQMHEVRVAPALQLDLSFATRIGSGRIGSKGPTKSLRFAQISICRGFEYDIHHDIFQSGEQGDIIPKKYRTSLPFPLLDSFPPILPWHKHPGESDAVPIQTVLSADSSIATKLTTMGRVLNRHFPSEEREDLTNSMNEVAEEYKEGWFSDSEDFDY